MTCMNMAKSLKNIMWNKTHKMQIYIYAKYYII